MERGEKSRCIEFYTAPMGTPAFSSFTRAAPEKMLFHSSSLTSGSVNRPLFSDV